MESDWKDIKFKLNLNAVVNHIEFLAQAYELKDKLVGEVLDKAIYRYEKIWLSQVADSNAGLLYRNYHRAIYPPIDVAWIWHCHLLSPTDYIKDCDRICCRPVVHETFSRAESSRIATKTKLNEWKKTRPSVSFSYSGSPY